MKQLPTYTEQQLVDAVLAHGPAVLRFCETSESLEKYRTIVRQECLPYPNPPQKVNTAEWLIPYSYQQMDIEEFCLCQCATPEQVSRVKVELALFHKYDMIPVLKMMKFVVDTLRKNNVVWGVGRGSSVASYCLYLIGVHKIDSIKYNLPLDEFFR
jgi:DNA polymerase III alpha subunit